MARDPRRDLARIYEAAVAAADPVALVRSCLSVAGAAAVLRDGEREIIRWDGSALVVGAGKASARMAAGCEAVLGPDRVRGLVVVADGTSVSLDSIEVVEAGHPVPDSRGAGGTDRICWLLGSAEHGPVLCLISGGASSLLVRPRPPVTLRDAIETNRLLLQCGADIHAVNAVRKHLSEVKGGGLLRFASAKPIVTLILSDVVGDQPSVVGSGPTTSDRSTYADAEQVLERFGVFDAVPASVRTLLARGRRGEVPETVRGGDLESRECPSMVIGSNRTALQGAAREAQKLGYEPIVAKEPITGETGTAASAWFRLVRAEMQRRSGEACCFIAGGETTVEVRGKGRGGRNTHFALSLVESLKDLPIVLLSAGTDGIDGPTDAAGAFAAGDTASRARARGIDPETMLESNDSYSFFESIGDLHRCGPTGTNVMDIKLALAPTSG